MPPATSRSRWQGEWHSLCFLERQHFVPVFLNEGGRTVDKFLVKAWVALRSKKGQSLVEYALILALVAIVVIAALTALGGEATNKMTQVANTLGNA